MKEKLTPVELLKKYQLLLYLVVIVIIMGVLQPQMFFSANFFINVFLTIAIYIILISGTGFCIVTGNIDLSVSRIAALGCCILVKNIMDHDYSTGSVWGGCLLAIIVCVALGAINGVFVHLAGMNAMIVTLATQKIIESGTQLYIDNQTLIINKPYAFWAIGNFQIAKIPMVVFIAALCLLVSWFVLTKTVFGRQVYATGGNKIAARYTGINVKKIGVLTYAISGFTAAIGGIAQASFTQQATYFTLKGYEGYVLLSCGVGGLSMMGGRGTVIGAMFGAFLLGIMNRSMVLLGINAQYHDIVRGLVIIIAFAIDMINPKVKVRQLDIPEKKDDEKKAEAAA